MQERPRLLFLNLQRKRKNSSRVIGNRIRVRNGSVIVQKPDDAAADTGNRANADEEPLEESAQADGLPEAS